MLSAWYIIFIPRTLWHCTCCSVPYYPVAFGCVPCVFIASSLCACLHILFFVACLFLLFRVASFLVTSFFTEFFRVATCSVSSSLYYNTSWDIAFFVCSFLRIVSVSNPSSFLLMKSSITSRLRISAGANGTPTIKTAFDIMLINGYCTWRNFYSSQWGIFRDLNLLHKSVSNFSAVRDLIVV